MKEGLADETASPSFFCVLLVVVVCGVHTGNTIKVRESSDKH